MNLVVVYNRQLNGEKMSEQKKLQRNSLILPCIEGRHKSKRVPKGGCVFYRK